jgi:hypothetical protein
MLRMTAIAISLASILAACNGTSSTSKPDAGGMPGGDPLDPSLAPPLDTDPSHYPPDIWVTDGMVKVHPDAMPGAAHWADLHAAKNETESFQIHVRNGGAADEQMSVTLTDLIDARSGRHITATTDIVVSREAYLDITTLSDANGTLGTTPDPLIPTIDPYVHEQRTAFPVTIPAGETRSAWIDISVPADAPSGFYLGTAVVANGTGSTLASLPVRLAVWDVALPPTATLRSGFGLSWNGLCVQEYGSYAACGAYPGSGGDADTAIELTHIAEATMFLDYRVSLAADVYATPDNNDWTHFDSLYGPLMDGTAPTRLAGAKLTHLWYNADIANATILASWTDHFTQKGWLDRTSAYYCDEPPNGCSWAETQMKADFIHASAPTLMTLLTTDLPGATANDLLDRIDIMVPIVESMEARGMPSIRGDYDTWLAKGGKHLWWYQSCDEHESCSDGSPGPMDSTWPSYMVDATPVRNRVFQWLAYVYGIEGELYYDSDYCWDTACDGQNDPWVSIYAFGGNGDGTLFYPGTTAKIGGTTPVPVPSIRLALIRDGMEDFELLHALDAAGDAATAKAAAATFITNNYTFDNDPTKLQAARLTIGNALHKKVHP